MGDDKLAPETGYRNSTFSLVHGLRICLTVRKVEFLLGCSDIDAVPGQGTVVDRTMGYRKVTLGLEGNVVRPQNGVSSTVYFVDGYSNSAVSVGVFECEVYPDLGLVGEFLDIEFTCGDHYLPLDAIDHVAVDVDTGEGV